MNGCPVQAFDITKILPDADIHRNILDHEVGDSLRRLGNVQDYRFLGLLPGGDLLLGCLEQVSKAFIREAG